MIFNANTGNTGTSYTYNEYESPYELGLEGALMHVYENECNYNAIIRSVGLSELAYYSETGKDLFVNEAGAFSSFIEKVKTFFKKIIEKIKAIFHKFVAVMNQFFMKDKEFVKKYEKEVRRKSYNSDFEFEGWEFKNLDSYSDTLTTKFNDAVDNVGNGFNTLINSYSEDPSSDNFNGHLNGDVNIAGKTTGNLYTDNTTAENEIEKYRDVLLGGTGAKSYDSSEFTEELHNKCYGDSKETITITTAYVTDCLNRIKDTKGDIKKIDDAHKKITKAIENFIKALDSFDNKVNKLDTNTFKFKNNKNNQRQLTNAHKDAHTKITNKLISIVSGLSNSCTTAFGVVSGAFKDRNRQCRAVIVKCVGYKNKNESAYYGSYSDDIFSGVTIR